MFKNIDWLIDRYMYVDRYIYVDIELIKYCCSMLNIKICCM